ncbi:MAG TPA: hypothetical protein VMM17_05890 [Gemmatimonadaceae bacterium]|nr:hypothetical protein [Gemmatimonadaceae bacterium]
MAKQKESSPTERLQELIAERQRYEEWLAALSARRDAAPAHVLARVEEDYRGRIARLGEELGARAGELKERIRTLSERVSALRKEESRRRDERAEAELRTAVGEYSPGQWSEIAASADRDIAALEGDRQVMERELSDLQRVLSITTGSPPPASGAVAPPDATRTSPPPQQPAAAPTSSSTATAAAPPAPAAPQPAALRPPKPQPEPVSAAPAASARAPKPAPGKRSDPAQRQREGQEKTLMCNECGTANYPTEWYCEACGAELSTL